MKNRAYSGVRQELLATGVVCLTVQITKKNQNVYNLYSAVKLFQKLQ